jgi:hypothetical protein
MAGLHSTQTIGKSLLLLCSEEDSPYGWPTFYSERSKKLEGIIVTLYRRGFFVWLALYLLLRQWEKA